MTKCKVTLWTSLLSSLPNYVSTPVWRRIETSLSSWGVSTVLVWSSNTWREGHFTTTLNCTRPCRVSAYGIFTTSCSTRSPIYTRTGCPMATFLCSTYKSSRGEEYLVYSSSSSVELSPLIVGLHRQTAIQLTLGHTLIPIELNRVWNKYFQ